jgi:hypothetical protein
MMSKASNKNAAFLQALSVPTEEKPPIAANADAPTPKAIRAASRSGLKHIGGYFDRGDVEKIAILRARLGLDNSELIKLAVNELYTKLETKRAFGDA